MKKVFTVFLLFIGICVGFLQVRITATELTAEDKMKSVEGKYTLKVKVDKWNKGSLPGDPVFPDVSLVHEVILEIRYEGQKPGYTTPIFSVYVDGQKTEKVKVGYSSSGDIGLFVTANELPVPSLGDGRGVKGSLRFDYDRETAKYTLNEEPAATMVMEATYAVGRGTATMTAVPVKTEGNTSLTEGSATAGRTENAQPGDDTANGEQTEAGFVEEDRTKTGGEGEPPEEEVIEEEIIEEEVIEEETPPEEDEYEVVTQGLEGQITDSRGRVIVTMPDGSSRRVIKTMPLPEGATVQVDRNCWCEIKLSTGDIVQMKGPAVFTLPKTELKKKNPGLLERGMALFKSTTENIKDKLGFGEFRLETPSAVAGKRGTTFYVEVDDAGTSTFLLQEGAIEVTDQQGNTKLLEPGMKAVVEKGKPLVQTYYTDAEGKVFDEGLDSDSQFPWLLVLLAAVVIYLFYRMSKKKKAPVEQPVQPYAEQTSTVTAQPAAGYCSQCGNALKPTSKFCSSCGKTIQE